MMKKSSRKNHKKAFILSVVVCALSVLSACSKQVDQTTKAVDPTTGATVETTTVETVSPETKETPDTLMLKADYGFEPVLGTVEALAEDFASLEMTDKDGKKVTVNLKGTDIENYDELKKGSRISLIYKEGASLESDSPIILLDQQENLTIRQVEGTVLDQAMSSFTVKGQDGTETSFLKNNCEGLELLDVVAGEGKESGQKVKVTYLEVRYEGGGDGRFPLRVEGE